MIGIAYREDGRGKGMFYDHYTIQHSTRRSTCGLKVSTHDCKYIHESLHNSNCKSYQIPMNHVMTNYSEGIRKFMMEYLEKNENLSLKFQSEHKRRHGLPMIRDFSLKLKEIDDDIGLLVIVGHLKIMENDPSMIFRFEFERNIIRKALLIGQPLLCICSGSWRLWEVLGGSVSNINSNVRHASGMISLESNGDIKQQQQGHDIILQGDFEDISIPECTILKSSMFGKMSQNIINEFQSIPVNSIHWMSPQYPNQRMLDQTVSISALSIPDHSIEAFETKYGSPVMGIQWHPEAYILNNEQLNQQSILKYMAKAGDVFILKRKLLKQLLQTINSK